MKMIPDKGPPVLASSDMPVYRLQIGASRSANMKVLNILTNMIYKDKISAVWREYGCNGADANIEAGRGDTPIEITLPTKLMPEAVIRDFGIGLSEERMRDVFLKVGESTKDDSNEVTGMLGIGAKAGYAYASEMFTVSSCCQGEKSIYQFYRDKGEPSMTLVSREPSDAADGVEVRIPVRAEHLDEFVEKAERVFRYFRVRPIVHGGKLDYKRAHPFFTGADWRFTGDRRSVAVMGNVGYALDESLLDLGYNEPKISTLIRCGIELDFAIGDLEIDPSREGLQYKDETRKKIVAKTKKAIRELAELFKKQISMAPNLWEAKKAYSEAFEQMGNSERQTLRNIIDASVTWQGEKMNHGQFDLFAKDLDTIVSSFERRSGGRIRPDRIRWVYPKNNGLLIVFNDLASGKVPPSRIKGAFANNATLYQIVVLTFRTAAAKLAYWKLRQMDGVPMVNLSTLPPLLAAPGTSNSQHNPKHSAKAFVFDGSAACGDVRSLWWKIEVVDLVSGSGIYVELKRFKVLAPDGDWEEPNNFQYVIQNLRNVSLVTGKIYGFKKGKFKPGPGWVRLDKAVQAKIDKHVKDFGQQGADYFATCKVSRHLPNELQAMLPKDSLAYEAIETRKAMERGKDRLWDFIRARKHIEWWQDRALPKASTDLHALRDKVVAHYPMLAFIPNVNERNLLTAAAEYIKLVDTK
jgi:hypothetical protein